MNDFNISDIEKIVRSIVKEIKNVEPKEDELKGEKSNNLGIFDDMNEAIQESWIAQRQYLKYSLKKRNEIVTSIRTELSKHIDELSKMGVEETGM